MLRRYDSHFLDQSKAFDTYEVPAIGAPEPEESFFGFGVRFAKGSRVVAVVQVRHEPQMMLLALLASRGIRGLVSVPMSAEECERLAERVEQFFKDRDQLVYDLVASRTADSDLQVEVQQEVNAILLTAE
jgi:hypothetical protein